jgi:uncharacterized protein with beta-barrel porin domain
MKSSRRTWLGLLLASSALIAVTNEPAAAACAPDPAASGQTVTCTGSDTDGFTAGGGVNSLTLNVVTGATVTAPGTVITVNDQNTVNNAGTIAITNFTSAIQAGDQNTITNSGLITVLGFRGISAGDQNLIVNTGTITTTSGRAIEAFSQNTIINAGTIIATNGGQGIVLNNAPNTVTNTGTITVTGSGADGILFFSGDATVTNFGLIRATGTGASALGSSINVNNTVINNGTIDGFVNLQLGTLTNNGLLERTTGPIGFVGSMAQFAQGAAGTLGIRVDATLAHDVLTASAGANLAGTVRALVQPGIYGATQTYSGVMTSGGLTGAFTAAESTSPFLVATAINNGNNVDLTLTRVAFNAVAGLTDNQRAVASGLEGAYSPALTGNAATIYGNVFAATSVTVFDALSGEVATGVQNPSFALGEQFHGALLGQAQRWRAGQAASAPGNAAYRVELASAAPMFGVAQATPTGTTWPPRAVGATWAAWASGFGLSGSRDGDPTVGSARLSYSTGGGAFGADMQLNPNLLVGAAVAAGASGFSLDGRASSGDVRTVFFGLYGSWTMGPLYVDAALTYGHGQFSTSRTIALTTLTERATGEFSGNQYGGRLEAGWRFQVQRYELTPFVGLSVQALDQSGYTESTINTATNLPGILGLSYAGETTTSVRSFLGGQASTTYRVADWATLTPRIRLAWAHEFTPDRQVSASFLSIPGAAFTVNGARPARDAAIVGAGVDLGIGRNVALYAQFDGDLSGGGNAYAGSGGIRISW